MTNLESDLQTLVARHAALARGATLTRLLDALIDPSIMTGRPELLKGTPLFINLGADGKPTDGDHVAVYQTATDLIWTAAPLGTELTHPDAMKAASDCRLLGATDWRGPSQPELFSILDFEFWDPCVNPRHFKGPYGYTWSSTSYKGAAGYFRGVNLSSGDSGCYHQDYHYRALAVRAGQQLGLRI